MSPVPPVPLMCPGCAVQDTRQVLPLEVSTPSTTRTPPAFHCPHCNQVYPAVDGVWCMSQESARVSQPQPVGFDLPAFDSNPDLIRQWISQLSRLDPTSTEFREAWLPATFAMTHFPESVPVDHLKSELLSNQQFLHLVSNWLESFPLSETTVLPKVLEVGCGPGRLLHTITRACSGRGIGFDLRLNILRVAQRMVECGQVILPFRTEGKRFEPVQISFPDMVGAPLSFIQGDIFAPPFQAGTFQMVVAASVLDSLSDPLHALFHLDSFLEPGGLLLLATPYAWNPAITSPEFWLSQPGASGADIVREVVKGRHPDLSHLNYEVLAEANFVPWTLPTHAFLVSRFFLDVLLARKKG